MRAEGTGEGELAKLVPHHFFAYVDGKELPSIVNCKGVAHKLRGNGARPSPGFNGSFIAAFVHLLNFLEQLGVDVRSFFC